MSSFIKKGHHNNPGILVPYFGRKFHIVLFKFSESCKYNLNNENQSAINKLWGYSFIGHCPYQNFEHELPNSFGKRLRWIFGAIHKNSFRLGWNYNNETDKFQIFAYWYNNGIRGGYKLQDCNVNEEVRITLNNDYHNNHILITGLWTIKFNFPKLKIGMHHDLWFGGKEPAPHNMEMELEVYY